MEVELRLDQRLAKMTARMDRYAEERAEAERRFDQQFAEIGERLDQLIATTKSCSDDTRTLLGWKLNPSLGARSCKCFLSQDLACLQM